jgi:transcriptional regulator GlxA family with amidase domain
MSADRESAVKVLMLAIPETAGSALYGMMDVLLATGNVWQSLVRSDAALRCFDVRVVALSREPFRCGNRIPVMPDVALRNARVADIVIVPELWLGPDEVITGRYPEVVAWLRERYESGATLYSACSGAVLLAETGLLDGCDATSHWGYQDLFRRQYPKVRFRPEPNLVFADPAGRIVTAGGTTSWHDLAIHIIGRHASPAEAMRIAKVYLLKWHSEGQLPYESLLRNNPHADAVVSACEHWLGEHFREHAALQRVVAESRLPERTLKRRFRRATGLTLIDYLQNLRVEEAKRMLEQGADSVENISYAVGYEDTSFFRRLFKRRTSLTPSQYRRLFEPVMKSASAAKANANANANAKATAAASVRAAATESSRRTAP